MLQYYLLLTESRNHSTIIDVYNDYKDDMYACAMGVLKDHHLAEDAVQDAFYKIINYLNQGDGKVIGSLKGFVITITRNRSHDIRRYRQKDIPVEEVFDEDPDISETPLERIISAEGFNQLVMCISRLSENYCTALTFQYVHDLKPIEAAKIMQISVEQFYTYVSRGKRALQREWGEDA